MEHQKPSNTGKLISAMWPETQVINWSRVQPDEQLMALLKDHEQPVVLVFPEQYAVAGQQEQRMPCDSKKRTQFIILDATWQQARKIYRQSPYLHDLPLLSLSPDQASIYTLRRNRHDQHLCTAEVAALVLKQRGEPDQALLLQSLIQVYCDQYQWARKGQKQITESRALTCLQTYGNNEWSGV